ncbi:small subunit ribosomal protein 3 (apicoplast) [Plasmodium gonderi]|uniref:Small subunit ribosomal protein 3 n=1 Tax=Plasmodium gonderi TaxID=77519 RepID=A0A1Y1JUH0_PLAGO|nr:small subunit ribosomal protein 3 [Plasmodium gonderi]BBB58250.1 small subunit ribosomal protein 3 [Plasmodium gonderi]GAW84747.1 small subunit ribosomal protein 3 [Plasmodium gonderi]
MGHKVNPLIFRSLIYKNYINNFYINIINNKYYLLKILLIYFLYYSIYNNICNNNNNYINIHINFDINKFLIIFFLYDKNIVYNNYNFKYIFILLNYFNYYYYKYYNYICYFKFKYIHNIDINMIMFYVKQYYIKYKSLKLIFDYLYNNILKKYNYNIKGLKIKFSGCFKNSLKTKVEIYTYGIISLNMVSNNIKYLNDIIYIKYGILSIKIWLNN